MNFGIITDASLQFELKKEIGQEGKNSTVYIAHDKQLDAELVIKKIEKKKMPGVANFYVEAQKLYDSEHQHVVQIKYACQDNDHIYLAMPFYKNGSLKTLIDKRFLTVREVIRYSIQFLSGLNNIHVKKLIHFDIKPDNILLSNNNEALVSDFGLTKGINPHGFTEHTLVYGNQIPPEALSQSVHSMLYDIYNSGITMYRICNGNKYYYGQLSRFPDDGTYYSAILKGFFPNRNGYLPHIPKSLRKVINKAMSVNPQDRYQTVLELINELSPINQLLDWVYVDNKDYFTWTLTQEDKKIEVKLTINGSLFDIVTEKTIFDSGKTNRITAGCKSSIELKDIDKEVQAILLSHE